ncbi:MAG TPA: DCC1-like thiol-disulfide oxidoreductase family protein [Candidatus Elarobacter sp.]|nr:DCC1-like thiol-disulfide oxidoreductase family protein [Candidatus Elarobacter sp.]
MFDGVCNFCNGVVQFVVRNDPAARFAFAPLQSPEARALLGDAFDITREPETFVLLDHGQRYERSDAVLHLALGLRAPWPLAFAAILIPRPLRDAAYGWFARNRYRWFGRRASCPIPPPGLRERFLAELPLEG